MTKLRELHRCMRARRCVLLDDGRTGTIVCLVTAQPGSRTTVSVWTDTGRGPGMAKVDIARVVGPASR